MEPGNQREQQPNPRHSNALLNQPAFWARARREKQTRLSVFGEILRFTLVYIVGSILESLLLAIPMSYAVFQSLNLGIFDGAIRAGDVQKLAMQMLNAMPDWMTIAALFSTAGLGAAAVFYCRKIEHRSIGSMGLSRRGVISETAAGLLAGMLLFAGVILIGKQLGAFSLARIMPGNRELLLLVLALIASLVCGAARELMLRGYLATSINAFLPVIPAVLSSTMFSLLLATGVAKPTLTVMGNMLLMNASLCILTIKRGSLWAAIGLHGGWLFCQGYLFGFRIPEDSNLGVFHVTSAEYRELLTGGINGPDASICATVLWIVVLAVVLALPQRHAASANGESGQDAPID